MRVLVISNLFPPEARGGYELACGDVVRRWRAAGHTVDVLSSSTGELPLTSVHVDVSPPYRRIAQERIAQRALRAALDRQPDVVSVWNMAGLPITMLTTLARQGVPVLYVVADAWPVRAPAADAWLANLRRLPRLIARLLGLAARIPVALPALGPTGQWVFCSGSIRDQVVEGAPDHRPFADTTIVPLGVDLVDFPLAGGAEDRPWQGRLLFVGRLDPVKGTDTLVRALASLPGSTLTILGPAEPHHLERIRELIAKLDVGDRVTIDSVRRDQLADRYRGADVLVFPSEWDEPFGIVPLEAMASATPVIATGAGGSGDYLEHEGNCLLFRAGDPTELAGAIARLADDADLRRQLTTAGLRTAATYTTERLAEDLLRLHEELVEVGPSDHAASRP